MYVRLVKKPNDRVSIRIVESVRVGDKVKQKIVCGVGTAHKDDEKKISKLRNVAENVILSLKNEENPALPGFEETVHGKSNKKSESLKDQDTRTGQVSVSNLKEEARIHKGIEDIFGKMFDQLDLFNSIDQGYKREQSNELFKEIVLSRISNPASKRKSVKNIERDKACQVDLNKVYRMMDKVHNSQDTIRKKIANATTSLFKQSVDVAFLM